jgi:Calcium-dependent channel, 7TM region, putative phosphate
MGLSLELIRVVPIIQAAVRSNIGYSLTEKERSQTVLGMRPLSDPDHFHFARIFSSDILYFMVLFVYSTLAPIVSWFVGFFFLLMGSGYRHNFIYIYPKTPDSGGKLWIGFIKILMSCMLIAQLTIVGFLALKKSTIAVPLMLPLIGMTVVFNFFVRQRHFRISENLPACECLSKDSENIENIVSFDEFKDQYLQPSLTVSLIEPEWDQ